MAFSLRIKSFSQTISRQTMTGAWDMHQFVGAEPILVGKNPTLNIVTQSGRAVCYDGWLTVPAALFPDQLIEQPVIERQRLTPIEFEITWQYVMVCDDTDYGSLDHHALVKAPESPTFEDPS